MFIKFVPSILICPHILLYGCAGMGNIPDTHRQHDRYLEYPVGIVYSEYEPEIDLEVPVRGKAQGSSICTSA